MWGQTQAMQYLQSHGHLQRVCTQKQNRANGRQNRSQSRSPRRPPTPYKKDKMKNFRSRSSSQSRSQSPSRFRSSSKQVFTEEENVDYDEESPTAFANTISDSNDEIAFANAVLSGPPPPIQGPKPTPKVFVEFCSSTGKQFNAYVTPDTGCTFSLIPLHDNSYT